MLNQQFRNYIRSDSIDLTPREVLQASPTVLLGVSADAEEPLRKIKISSVFDLAMSRVFDTARRLSEMSDDHNSYLRLGMVPADQVKAATLAAKPIDQVQFEPIEALDGVGRDIGAALQTALQVKTVRDLALWPPYQNARAIFSAEFDRDGLPGTDPESPEDLVPRTGDYPTDRSLYQTFVLIDAPDTAATDLETAGPLLLAATDKGFTKPAIGAALTYSQEWFSQAVALGQLLHSVALAPGESTRLAVIDYERRTSGAVTEAVDQTEKLSNSILQNRAVSEITDAVAEESQEGFSSTKSRSNSSLSGEAMGGGAPLLFGGGASGKSRNTTTATTSSTSQGRREVSAHLQQDIRNATQQHAASARSRRAATITETSLQESETISTRTVTNYNHMHALSVQYYEVVQLYRTELRLQRAEGCLFIPMRVFDFSDESVVSRFGEILSAAALNDDAAELLNAAGGNVIVSPAFTPAFTILGGIDVLVDPQEAADRAKRRAIEHAKLKIHFRQAQQRGALTGFRDVDEPFQMSASTRLANISWTDPTGRLTKVVLIADDGSETTVVQNGAGLPVNPDLGAPISMSLLREIRLEHSKDDAQPHALPITLTFRLSGRSSELRFDCVLLKGRTVSHLLRIQPPIALGSVVPHLQEHALYYSQQIWLNADSQLIVMLLAPFLFRGKPVVDYIDLTPVTVLGNMLGFIWHDEDDAEFAAWKKQHANFADVDYDLVSVPSGGVFAEAVLGRFNSAEKLDLTRFWNWQDSPIPIVAPEIAAVQAGQHQPADAAAAGRLDQPIVNIVSPPTLPDPSTVAGTLAALNNGALFRDMSGLVQTIALAQAGLQAASQDALGGASRAGTNLANVAALQGKAFDAIIAVAGVLSGVPGVGAIGGKNISNAAGSVLLGKDLDAIPPGAGAAGQAPNPPPIDSAGGGTGAPGGGGTSPGNGTVFASTAGSNAEAAFDTLIGRPTLVGRSVQSPTTSASTPPSSASRPPPATAAVAIAEFRNRSGTSPFTLGPNSAAVRTAFADRLADLAANPEKFDQTNLMACGMAAFLHVWLKRDPLAAVNYAIDLFEHGRARIGSLPIDPNQDLLRQDYAKLVSSFGGRMPHVAEWVMMSALRNATPGRLSAFSFVGKPAPRDSDSDALRAQTQDLEGVVFPDEIATWLDATGIYSDVVNKANAAVPRDFSVSQSLFPDNSRDVILLMNTQMLNSGLPQDPCNMASSDLSKILAAIAFPNHYVVLEQHIQPPVNDTVSMTFWCWGDGIRNCMPYTVGVDTFKANFFGAVIGVH